MSESENDKMAAEYEQLLAEVELKSERIADLESGRVYIELQDRINGLLAVKGAVVAFRDGGGGPTLWQAVLTALVEDER